MGKSKDTRPDSQKPGHGKPQPFMRKLPDQREGLSGLPPGGTIRNAKTALDGLLAKGMLADPDEMLDKLLKAHQAEDPDMTERKLLLLFACLNFELVQSIPYGGPFDQVRQIPAEKAIEPSYRTLIAHLWRIQVKVSDSQGPAGTDAPPMPAGD